MSLLHKDVCVGLAYFVLWLLVSRGCCNKLYKLGNSQQVYSVRESRSVTSGYPQGWYLLRVLGEHLAHACLLASCRDQPSLAFFSIRHSDLCSCVHVMCFLCLCLSSVQFSHSVVSNSLQTHEQQHESVMPSNHLILCLSLLLLPSIFPSILCLS